MSQISANAPASTKPLTGTVRAGPVTGSRAAFVRGPWPCPFSSQSSETLKKRA